MGIAFALAPKPMLIPIFAWMLMWRRDSLAGLVAAAAATTLVGLLLLGTDLYGLWAAVLTATAEVTRSGNQSLWVDGVGPVAVILAVAVTLAAGWTIVRDEARGLVAAMLAGLLLAPYTLVYAVSILLLAIRPALRFAPGLTRILAIVANPIMVVSLVPWALAAIAGCLAPVLPARGDLRRTRRLWEVRSRDRPDRAEPADG